MTCVENWPLLESALFQIIRDPKSWEQATWGKKTECGTAFCLAGHLNVLGGAEPIWQTVYDDEEWKQANTFHYDGEARDAGELAKQLAGLDPLNIGWMAARRGSAVSGFAFTHSLFAASNTLYDLLEIVQDWAEQDGHTLNQELVDRLAVERVREREKRAEGL